jgi:adenylosuccinate lyase
MKAAMGRVRGLLLRAIKSLADFALKWKAQPTLAFTHFQPAQPTTVGKRAVLWLNDLLTDLEQLRFQSDNLKLLGCKGATGTCAGFLELFRGDAEKTERLEALIADKMGFSGAYPVSGQTYSRKVDFLILSVLSGIAQSAMKFSNDIRLLSHLREVDEPFSDSQVGSSAMAYKRNPMRSERIASLSRYVITLALNPALTAGGQWFERTLDDSANRRLSIAEAFLGTDAVLSLYINVIDGLTVYPKMIEKRLAEELPFMATENILMRCVGKGGDRQILHEAIRTHSVEAARRMKTSGESGDLLGHIAADPIFGVTREELDGILTGGGFVGLAERQTEKFILSRVTPVLEANKDELGAGADVTV